MTDGETNTLARRGLEEHFSSCAVVSVFWLWRKQLQVILTYHTSCAVVSFFCCWGKQFLVAQVSFLVVAGNNFRCYFLTYRTIPVVPLCQFVGCGKKQFLVTQFLRKISYLVSLIERRTTSKCVYFIRPKFFYSVFLNSLSISCTRKIGNCLSAFCEGIYLIPMLYPRKLCKF